MTANEKIQNLINIETNELGYVEGPNNWTKYGEWYGLQGPWCAIFQSWSFAHAGLENTCGRGAACYQIRDYILSHGGRQIALSEDPQPGDITFNFWPGNTDGLPDHIGLVVSFDKPSYTITCIEGNWSDKVSYHSYGYQDRLSDEICYILRPAYEDDPAPLPRIQYEAHCQNVGWQGIKKDGEIAGTTGQGLRLEAVRIWLPEIQYRAHVENIGWMDWVSGGEVAGTTGRSLRLEALEIKTPYLLSVQEHVADIGWLPETAAGFDVVLGTVGRGKQMEAFRLMLK